MNWLLNISSLCGYLHCSTFLNTLEHPSEICISLSLSPLLPHAEFHLYLCTPSHMPVRPVSLQPSSLHISAKLGAVLIAFVSSDTLCPKSRGLGLYPQQRPMSWDICSQSWSETVGGLSIPFRLIIPSCSGQSSVQIGVLFLQSWHIVPLASL